MSTQAHNLGSGPLGTLLRHNVFARDSGDWTHAHSQARTAARTPVSIDHDGGLFHGAAALAFVLHIAGHPAYRAVGARLDPIVCDQVRSRLDVARRRMASRLPPRLGEFDLISGLTGLGALLLHRGIDSPLLSRVLRYLIDLLDDTITVDGVEVPGWWSSDTPRGVPARAPSSGHANFGMAHGVSGPIALLAISARAGHHVPGQHDCLRRACQLLCRWAQPLESGVRWPETMHDPHTWHRPPTAVPQPGRPSWCYGTPGVARALQLAAIACDQPDARRMAEDALSACATDITQLQLLDDNSVCHGTAGLALTLNRATADADTNSNLHHLPPTACATLRANPAHLETPRGPGLLTGLDGVQLAAHTLATSGASPATWETCLLLDGRRTL